MLKYHKIFSIIAVVLFLLMFLSFYLLYQPLTAECNILGLCWLQVDSSTKKILDSLKIQIWRKT